MDTLTLEQCIKSNNYHDICVLLKHGTRLLQNNNHKNNILRYAFRNNRRGYITIYYNLRQLQILKPILIQDCKCCNKSIISDNHTIKCFILLNNILDGLFRLRCECPMTLTYHKYYTEDFLHFCEIYKLFSSYLLLFLNEFTDTFIKNTEDINFMSHDFCIHDDMKNHPLIKCNKSNNNRVCNDDIDLILNQLEKATNWYIESAKIIVLLLEQQTYEFILYTLDNGYKDDEIVLLIDKLYVKKEFININYRNYENDLNILECILEYYNYPNSVKKIIECGGKLKNYAIISTLLKNKNYTTLEHILDILDPTFINKIVNGNTIVNFILNDFTIDSVHKTKLIKKLLDRYDINIRIYNQSLLNVAIQLPASDDLVNYIVSHGCNIDYRDIIYGI